MLERLLIEQFQVYTCCKLELCPTITVLVGRTNVGKTSALRAFRWLVTNRPLGSAFIRNSEGLGGQDATPPHTAKVTAVVDGHTCQRVRGRGVNAYLLDGKRYKAQGTGVPGPIAALLNLGPVNFHGQHDAPFLLWLTPGEAARELNAVVNLGLIDRVLGRLAVKARQAHTAVAVCRKRLKQAKAESAGLAWVPAAQKALTRLQKLERNWQAQAARRTQLQELLTTAARLTQVVNVGQHKAKAATTLAANAHNWLTVRQRRQHLASRLQEAERWQQAQRAANGKLQQVKQELASKTEGRCPICHGPLTS